MKYYLDTSVMIEISFGNKKYEKYLDEELHTSIFNLYELYFYVLNDFGDEKAKEVFSKFIDIAVSIESDDIFLASGIKSQLKHVSFSSALGFALAKNKGMKFLTNNKEFEKIDNAEFVK